MAENKKPSNKKDAAPNAPQNNPNPVAPDMHPTSNSGGTQVQNVSQNHITESGNETRGNSPGGNLNEILSQRINKPRSSPNPSQQKQK
jgi:hypothetical protein